MKNWLTEWVLDEEYVHENKNQAVNRGKQKHETKNSEKRVRFRRKKGYFRIKPKYYNPVCNSPLMNQNVFM